MKMPSVGRIVHYQSHGTPDGTYKPESRAAIVTQVFTPECVSLCILNPTGMFFTTSVMRDDGTPAGDNLDLQYRGGSWHWPPYVPETVGTGG